MTLCASALLSSNHNIEGASIGSTIGTDPSIETRATAMTNRIRLAGELATMTNIAKVVATASITSTIIAQARGRGRHWLRLGDVSTPLSIGTVATTMASGIRFAHELATVTCIAKL